MVVVVESDSESTASGSYYEDDELDANGEGLLEDSFSLLEPRLDASAEFEVASSPPFSPKSPKDNTNTLKTGGHNRQNQKSDSKQQQQQQQQHAAFSASFAPHSSNFDSSYNFSAGELMGLTTTLEEDEYDDDDDFGASSGSNINRTKVSTSHTVLKTTGGGKQVLLPNNHLPFVGRNEHLATLHKAVERISLEWMENPSEVVWISGKKGVGKTTLVQHATELKSGGGGGGGGGFAKSFICRGTCEQYYTATQPFQALTDCLNDLCWQLRRTSQNGPNSSIWKQRLEEALGGEGPLVGTICPALLQLLECPPMDRRPLMVFDANTPQRLDRLAFAVRDLLLAVGDHHPVVMIVDQIHYADPDSLQLMKELLTTKPLQNFLLIGIYDTSLVQPDGPLMQMKELLAKPNAVTATRTTEIRLQGLSSEQAQQVMNQVLLLPRASTPGADPNDDLADLAELVFVLTKGNPLWMAQLLRLWNDQKLITQDTSAPVIVAKPKNGKPGAAAASPAANNIKWTWNRKKIKKEVKRWREEGLECSKSVEGVVQARLELLPKKIQFVVMVLGKLKLSMIQLHDDPGMMNRIGNGGNKAPPPPLLPKSRFYRVFAAAAYRKNKQNEKDPITSQDELEKMVLKACAWGILKKLHRPGYYKFANDLMRECAATLTSPYEASKDKSGGSKVKKADGVNPLKFQLYMGTELSALSMEATKAVAAATANATAAAPIPPGSPNPQAAPAGGAGPPRPPLSPHPGQGPAGRPPSAALVAAAQQRERYKFLAVEQLHTVHRAMDDNEKGKLAKINLEAAEIAISKTAFQTAIVYLERGIAAVDHTLRWQQRYYEVTMRTFLYLARMRLCCGRNSAAKAACEEILESCGTLKDRIHGTQVLLLLLQREEKYDKALERLLDMLQRLGEVFPPGEEAKHIIEREINSLRKGVGKMNNQQLLNPPKMTDKKAADIMMLLAIMVDISPHATKQPNHYNELAMIRMMHMSIKMGFTRQYPMAFSLFGVALVERGYVKEAHRVGQVAEKIARLSDFYGGEAVALFHWHISHWRRTYKRNLQPILRIYNAQVDAGDFLHVGFSISTYIQYHLASGFDIDKLSDNLQLFQGLYVDYKLNDNWFIQISQQAVSNLMGETVTPLIFFGVTLSQQDGKIEEFRKARLPQAIEYLYLLRLFVAFFFHNLDVMEECFEMIETPPKGVWIPWMTFLECFMLIQHLPASKGKPRKELKEKVELLKNRLIDWYNEGAPNPSAMISILEAEWIIAKEAGKGLSAMKAQELFNEAVEAAAKTGCTHLEAFACERAGMHFLRTGVEGFCADYMKKSHKTYDQCQYISKVIDLETNHGELLNIKHKRARPASAYSQVNASMQPSEKKIGGGQQVVRTVNVAKGLKKAAKVIRKGGVKKTGRKVKEMFKHEKAAPAPWGWGSKNQLALDEDGGANEDDPMSPSPKERSSRLFGRGGKKKTNKEGDEEDDDEYDEEEEEEAEGGDTLHVSPSTASPTTKSPGKSPRRPMSRLFRKAKPPLSEDTEEDEEAEEGAGEDINDVLKSPKPKGSRTLQADGAAMNVPFDDDSSEEEEEVSPKAKKDDKKKKSKKGTK